MPNAEQTLRNTRVSLFRRLRVSATVEVSARYRCNLTRALTHAVQPLERFRRSRVFVRPRTRPGNVIQIREAISSPRIFSLFHLERARRFDRFKSMSPSSSSCLEESARDRRLWSPFNIQRRTTRSGRSWESKGFAVGNSATRSAFPILHKRGLPRLLFHAGRYGGRIAAVIEFYAERARDNRISKQPQTAKRRETIFNYARSSATLFHSPFAPPSLPLSLSRF